MDEQPQQPGGQQPPTPPNSITYRQEQQAAQTPQPESNKSKTLLIVGSIITAVLIIGGGVGAYFAGWLPFARSLTPDEVIDRMLNSMQHIDAAEYSATWTFKSEPRDEGAKPWTEQLPEFKQNKQAIKRDRERLSEAQYMQTAIRSYYRDNGIDPVALTEIAPSTGTGLERIADPSTGQPYEYRRIGGGTDFILRVQMETDAAIEAYKDAFENLDEQPVIKEGNIIEITKETPTVFASVDFSDTSPYPLGFGFNELYQLLPSEIDAKISVAGQNETTVSEDNDAKYRASGTLALGGTTFTGDFELRKKGKDYYAKIHEAPSLGFFDLAALKQKWIKAEPEDAYGTTIGGVLQNSDTDSVEEQGARLVRQYELILRLLQQEDVLQVVKEFPKVEEEQATLYHYQVRLDRQKFPAFYKRLTEEMKSEFGEDAIIEFNESTLTYLESSEFEQFYDALEEHVLLEIWIDDEEFWPRRISYSLRLVPPDSVAKLRNKQFMFGLEVGTDKINEPVTVDVPQEHISVDEAQALVTGKSVEQIQLSRQQAQVTALRRVLDNYKAHTGAYPDELSNLLTPINEVPANESATPDAALQYRIEQLKEENKPFIKAVPNDVYTSDPYRYTSTGQSYELKYMVNIPPPSETDISNYTYDWNRRTFVEGFNTATPEQLSVEASN